MGCALSLSGLCALSLGQPARAADPQPPSAVPLPAGAKAWKLILNENFDGTAYDTSRWNPYSDWGGTGSFNNGRENYYPSQVRVKDGICDLVAEPNPGATAFANSYKSGELISARANTKAGTPYKFSFLYGYVEARLKIVATPGFFGAFWMLPDKADFKYEWEIDILEVLGNDHRTMFQTYNYAPGLPDGVERNASWTPNKGSGNNGSAPVLDYSGAYHTFGVDWEPDHLTFYIDGIASGTFPTPGSGNGNIARTPGYIIIQQMVENNWLRSIHSLVPDTTSSVDTFQVDYVRVWQGSASAGIKSAAGQATGGSDRGPAPGASIFDTRGRLVRRLGAGEAVWDGADAHGKRVREGVYYRRVDGADAPRPGAILNLP